MLEKIQAAIRAEQEKMYYLSSSPNPRYELESILTRVFYLNRLEAEELRKKEKI